MRPTWEVLNTGARARLGESPWWDGTVLSWVDILGDRVHLHTWGAESSSSFGTPAHPGYAIPDSRGGWLVGLPDGVWEVGQSEQWTRLWRAPHDPAVQRLNDAKTDPRGRLWFGSMSYAEVEPISALYRWDAGVVTAMADGIITSNGLGWSPDGQTFYYTDSLARTIWSYVYDLEDGTIHDRRVFASDPPDRVPDGLAVDADGCVWSAKWDGGCVVRYTPRGDVDRVIDTPVARPTSCAFAGPDRSTLAVTTAASEGARAAELDGCVLLLPTSTSATPTQPIAREESDACLMSS